VITSKSGLQLATAIVIGLLVLPVSAGAAGPESGINVNVVNPPSNPVPVTLHGTSVVTGAVAVTNTPDVNVVNEASVRDADNPAFQPVAATFSATLSTGAGPGANVSNPFYTVPSGKRLVIEYVDSNFVVGPASNAGKTFLSLEVSIPGTPNVTHAIGTSSESAPCTLSQACFVVAKPVRIYVDAGAQLRVTGGFLLTQSSSFSFLNGTVNGYLVDLP